MIICDICEEPVKDNHIQIAVIGENRMKIYDFGFKTTHFDVCSIKCGMKLLEQIKTVIPKGDENDI